MDARQRSQVVTPVFCVAAIISKKGSVPLFLKSRHGEPGGFFGSNQDWGKNPFFFRRQWHRCWIVLKRCYPYLHH